MRPRRLTLRHVVVGLFAAVGVGLLPWAVWLSSTLPPRHDSAHWDVAWSGFDVALALALCGTALAAWRRSPWVGALAGATGTLLVTDAWFDIVLESHGSEATTAVLEGALAELPLAAFCFWIAYRTERFLVEVVDAALGSGAASHLAAAGKGPAEGDFIGVLEVSADGKAAGEPSDADAPAAT